VLKDLVQWLIGKADAAHLRSAFLRLGLLTLLGLALSAQFPASINAARVPFNYVELRHEITPLDAKSGLYRITVRNSGTAKADAVRIHPYADNASLVVREVTTAEEFKMGVRPRFPMIELKRLAPGGELILLVLARSASLEQIHVQVSADQTSSAPASVPTWVQQVASAGQFVRSTLVTGVRNLRLYYQDARTYRDRGEFVATFQPLDNGWSVYDPASHLQREGFSGTLNSAEFRSSVFACCVFTLLVSWTLGKVMAYLSMSTLAPAVVFAYFPAVGFEPGVLTSWIAAAVCVFPALAMWIGKQDAKPNAQDQWQVAVGVAAVWGMVATTVLSNFFNSPPAVGAALLLLALFMFEPPNLPAFGPANIAFESRPTSQQWWIRLLAGAGLAIFIGPVVWSSNQWVGGFAVAALMLVLFSLPIAVLAFSRADNKTTAERAVPKELNFPPLHWP